MKMHKNGICENIAFRHVKKKRTPFFAPTQWGNLAAAFGD
jgi:hypothetical protein